MFHQNKFLPEAILQRHCGSVQSIALPMMIVIDLKKCQWPFLRSAVEQGLEMLDYLSVTSRDCFWLGLLNSATSFVAGFVVFSVLGLMTQKEGVTVNTGRFRSRFGLHRLPSGNSYDAFATVLDCLLLPDASSTDC